MEAPQLAQEVYDIDRGKLLRRGAAAVGGVIATAVAVDQIGAAIRWARGNTNVRFQDSNPDTSGDTAWIFFPGLGQIDTAEDAQAIAPFLDAPAVALQLPQRKPTLEKIGNAVSDFVTEHNIKRIRPYGRSMGWITAGAILPYLPDDVMIDAGIADGSPHDLSDARKGQTAANIVRATRYSGGIASMFAVEVFHAPPGINQSIQNTGSHFRRAWDTIAASECSAALYTTQLGWLHEAGRNKYAANFKERLTPNARLAYVMAEPAENDQLIHVKQAANKLELAADHPFTRLHIEGITHARPNLFPNEYEPHIREFLGTTALSREVELD